MAHGVSNQASQSEQSFKQ